MPDVRMPDGTVVKNVPAGTTKEELLRRLGKTPEPQPPLRAAGNPLTQAQIDQQVYDEATWYEKAQVGAKESVMETQKGLEDLHAEGGYFGPNQISPRQTRGRPIHEHPELERSQQVQGGWKTAGELGADLGQLLVPGSRIARVSSFPRMLAGETAMVTGFEALKDPDPGETRGGNAAIAAAATPIGGTAFPLAMKYGIMPAARRGLDAVAPMDDAARAMLDDGVKLTPGMARPNLAGVEKIMGKIPGVANRVEDLQREALVSWNNYIQRKVGPIAADMNVTGREGFQELQKRLSQAYTDLWGKVTPDNINMNQLYDDVTRQAPDVRALPGDYQGLGGKAIDDTQNAIIQFAETGDTTLLDALDDSLRTYQQTAGPQGGEFFQNLRNSFRNALPEDVGVKLREVDAAYRNYAVTRRAGSYVDTLVNEGIFTPRSLLGAVKAKNSEQALVRGTGAMQEKAAEGGQILGSVLPNRLNAEEPAVDLAVRGTTAASMLADPATTGAGIIGLRGAVTPAIRDAMTGRGYVPGHGPLAAMGVGTTAADMLPPHLEQASSIIDRLAGRFMSDHDRKMEELRQQAAAIRNQR